MQRQGQSEQQDQERLKTETVTNDEKGCTEALMKSSVEKCRDMKSNDNDSQLEKPCDLNGDHVTQGHDQLDRDDSGDFCSTDHKGEDRDPQSLGSQHAGGMDSVEAANETSVNPGHCDDRETVLATAALDIGVQALQGRDCWLCRERVVSLTKHLTATALHR